MKSHWRKGLKIALFVAVFVAVLGLVVMSLWNWLMPALFAGPQISFWQAVGLLVLSRILLGGFGGRRGGMHWRRRMIEQWDQMTPEEREKFREVMRPDPVGRATTEPKR
jgi:hypothetical protein